MKKSFKKGVGFALGMFVGGLIIGVTERVIVGIMANDENFMSKIKDEEPELYDKIRKTVHKNS